MLAEHLIKEKSADVRIFLPKKGPFSTLCQKYAIPFTIYNSSPYISTSFSLFYGILRIPNPLAWIYNIYAILLNSIRIKKKLKQHVPDLAVTKGLLTHISAGLACKSLNLPVIWHLQDLISKRYFGILNSIFNQLANIIPDYIICDGKIIKDSLRGPVYQRSDIVLNGIKTDNLIRCLKSRDEVRRDLYIPTNAYVIGNLARFTPWKGQEFLLQAFTKYSKQNKNAYLMLVGSPLFDNDRYYKRLKQLVSKNDLGGRVIMPGYRSDLRNIFSAMDLFVYPSVEKDTSPLALISAISFGLPVVISSINTLEEILGLCPSLDTFNPYQIDGIISLMEKYEDESQQLIIGEINRKNGVRHFDISVHGLKMGVIFRRINKSA